MNREQAKAIWPMVKAFGEGKKIEFNAFDNPPNSGWLPTANPDWSNDAIIFRIKPEPKVIPWTWETVPKDLLKVVNKATGHTITVLTILKNGIGLPFIGQSGVYTYNYEYIKNNHTQLDGSPCGQEVS